MTTFFTALFAFIIVLGPLVFVHELGHFLLAKLFRVRVLAFSLGFGPKLVSRKYGDTVYSISSIPLGGYVKMYGEQPEKEEPDPKDSINPVPRDENEKMIVEQFEKRVLSQEDKKVSFSHKPVWQRFSIVASGPIFNLFFAVFIYFLIFLFMGLPEPVDTTIIGSVMEKSPAKSAGIEADDEIIEINGHETTSWLQVIDLVKKSGGKPIELVLLRNGKKITLSVVPEMQKVKNIYGEETDREKYMLGIVEKYVPVFRKASPGEAFNASMITTWNVIAITGTSLVKMVQRKVPASEMGGPIRIAEYAGQKMKSGWLELVSFTAILSIGLGILNLLPIPVLDGGHLVFLTLEGIRRKPLSDRAMEMGQKVGIFLLASLMIFVFYNDILRIVQRWTGS